MRPDLRVAAALIVQAGAEGLFVHQIGGFDADAARRENPAQDRYEIVGGGEVLGAISRSDQ